MRKEKVDGRVVIVHERGDGIRRRYRESLAEGLFQHPRRLPLNHAEGWYLRTDGPARRPAMGVYALAAYAENMLWRARFARKGWAPPLEKAVRFFAETRRALQNVLSTYRIGRRLTAKQAESLRRVVERLQASAREVEGSQEKIPEKRA